MGKRTINKIITFRQEQDATSLENLYSMWCSFFWNRIIRLFEYKNLPASIPQRELEKYAMANGINYVAYNKKNNIFVTGQGSVYGVTQYEDVFTKVIYAKPNNSINTLSGNPDIGKGAVVLNNTSTQLSMIPFVERYASLMAHADLTLKCALINQRQIDTLVAADDSVKDSINQYYSGKYQGSPRAIIDKSILLTDSANVINIAQPYHLSLREIIDTENEILRGFYRDIGVRWTKDKRAQMGESEVEADESLLLFNISDMLQCRREFCKEFNKVFTDLISAPISVKLIPELEIIERGNSDVSQSSNESNDIE